MAGGIAILLVVLSGLALKQLMVDDRRQDKRRIQVVTLMPPPPPPKVEPPPEPEKKEEVIEEKPEEAVADEIDDSMEDMPSSDELGLDTDATGSGDNFGLRAKKGGQSIIGGSEEVYKWYTSLYSTDLQKIFNEIIQKAGGLPDGEFKATVKVTIDGNGRIIDYRIISPSGNRKMDAAVENTLQTAEISEPPPPGMPKTMKFSISSKS